VIVADNRTPAEGWQKRFLDHLRETGNVRRSCEAASVARSWAYDLREKDPAFAAEWKLAALDAADLIEEVVQDRGVNGWDEPVWYKDAQVGTVRKYSNTLAVFLLKHANPEKYGDRTELRHSGPDGGPIQIQQQTADLSHLTDEQLDAIDRARAILDGHPDPRADQPGEGEAEVQD
jgi:hypothetical protein